MRSSAVILLALAGAVLAAGLIHRTVSKRLPGGPEPRAAGMEAARSRAAAPPAAAVSPITGQESAASLQALADTVRARALRGDTLGLIRLLIDDTLFRRHVWPASPAYDPARESAFQFVRGMDKANNAKGLRRMLYDVQSLGPAGVPDSIACDTVAAAGGALYVLKPVRGVRLFGGALAVNGAYRVLNYSESGASQSAMATE